MSKSNYNINNNNYNINNKQLQDVAVVAVVACVILSFCQMMLKTLVNTTRLCKPQSHYGQSSQQTLFINEIDHSTKCLTPKIDWNVNDNRQRYTSHVDRQSIESSKERESMADTIYENC